MKRKVSVLLLAMFFVFFNVFSVSVYAETTKKKAIIVIPGIMGSNLKDSDGKVVWVTNEWIKGSKQLYYFANGTLSCTSDGASEKALTPATGDNEYGAIDTYKKLVTQLRSEFSNDYDVVFFGYDWRLDNTYSAEQLQELINKYDEVSIVAHSMGGLVTNKYLDLYGSSKIEKVVTLGTPYWGALDAAQTLHTGQVSAFPDVARTLMSGVMKGVMANYLGITQLLPDSYYATESNWLVTEENKYEHWYDYIWPNTYEKLNNPTETEQFMENDFNSMLVKNAKTFHDSLYETTAPIQKVNHTIIVGSGIDTLNKIKLTTTTVLGEKVGLSVPESYSSGDGTVSLISSTMGGSIDYISRNGIDHTGLVNDDDTISIVINSLKNTNTSESLNILAATSPSKTTEVKTTSGLSKEQVASSTSKYKFTFSGDVDFEALKNNKATYHIYKKTQDSNTKLDIASDKKFKINAISSGGNGNVFLINYSDSSYTFKLKSNKNQKIDIAMGPNNKIYSFNDIQLTNKSVIYISSNASNTVNMSIDYDGNGTIDNVIKPNIKDVA